MAETILIVEDELDLAATLEYRLGKDGYDTVTAATGAEALAALQAEPRPDLVLLDLMLPDMSGMDICRQIRREEATANLPVIMVTARAEEIDRVVGFEVGADDYVCKPFSVRELVLRVKAQLRRGRSGGPNRTPSVAFGRLKVNSEAHRAWVDGEERPLTALEFKLLETFLARRGRVQSRERLLDDVWGITADVTTRTVDTHVKRLRQKLGPAGQYIETLRGVGYRFCDEPPARDTPADAGAP
ncbi:MAG: response regulator transcription factor [Deltaproteobacteria bacterium]|nr:response regulator transcription factor [Deltaproteobacteria bacterium]